MRRPMTEGVSLISWVGAVDDGKAAETTLLDA